MTDLLKELVRFQDRLYQKDPVKAKAKRRLVLGLREVLKHLKLRKLKCVIISPNCEKIQAKGKGCAAGLVRGPLLVQGLVCGGPLPPGPTRAAGPLSSWRGGRSPCRPRAAGRAWSSGSMLGWRWFALELGRSVESKRRLGCSVLVPEPALAQ